MKIRRRAIAFGLLAALLAGVLLMLGFVLYSPRLGSVGGAWTSTAPYQGNAPGTVGLVIEEDDRVRVTAAPESSLWWATGQYELHLRGDTIEVYSGQRLRGELLLRQGRGDLRLLDRSMPTEVLRLRKIGSA